MPRPVLPAAVIEDQDAPVARVVPRGAKIKRAGKVNKFILGYTHKPAQIGGFHRAGWTLAGQRLSEIEALIAHRHGGPCDTDDGEQYFMTALPHIVALTDAHGQPRHRAGAIPWCERWTPRLLGSRPPRWCDQVAHEYATRPRRLRADTVAKMLGVTNQERCSLGLTTIGAKDFDQAQRIAARKCRHAQRQKERRSKAEGYKPREEAATRTEPWIRAGFKTRRTWERHGKPDPTAASDPQATANVADPCTAILEENSSARLCDDESTNRADVELCPSSMDRAQRNIPEHQHAITYLPPSRTACSRSECV